MKKIIALYGLSAAGKSTLAEYLSSIGVPQVISHTTRNVRANEIPGMHYYYVDDETFENTQKIEEGIYDGFRYGISKHELEDKLSKYDMICAIVEIQGLRSLKRIYGDIVEAIFITAPNELIFKRFIQRETPVIKISDRVELNNEMINNGDFHLADYIIENINLNDSIIRLDSIIHNINNDREIERKFFVKSLPNDINTSISKHIEQAYLSYSPEIAIRKCNNVYLKTIKSETPFNRKELEKSISIDEYENALKSISKQEIIKKIRIPYLVDHHITEIDLYSKNNLMLVEVKFMTEEEAKSFVPPNWFGTEVTYDAAYKDKNIARNRSAA